MFKIDDNDVRNVSFNLNFEDNFQSKADFAYSLQKEIQENEVYFCFLYYFFFIINFQPNKEENYKKLTFVIFCDLTNIYIY